MYSDNVKGHFLVYSYFWIVVFQTVAVSFCSSSSKYPALGRNSRTHVFVEIPHFFFFLFFFIKCINILLIIGHYTWIHTYSHLYIHIDIFSQLRKNVPFYTTCDCLEAESHT